MLLAGLIVLPGGAEAQSRGRGAVQADYDPSMGVRVTSPDGVVQLTAPTGALGSTATFSHEQLDPPGPVGGGVRLSKAFKLEAKGNGGASVNKFNRPLNLVVKFDDADIANLKVPARALRLFYQDSSSAWHAIPTTVDTAGKSLRADVDHFTVFAAGTSGANDTFDRPDDPANIGTAVSGQEWRSDGSIWGICGGDGCSTNPAGGGNYARLDAGFLDQAVSVTIAPRAAGASGQAGIMAQMTPDWSTNLLYAGLDPSGQLELWTLSGGNWSSGAIASKATGKTGASPHVLEVHTAPGTATLLVDGNVELGPIPVPAAPADATFAGLFVDTTGAANGWPKYDDFVVAPGG